MWRNILLYAVQSVIPSKLKKVSDRNLILLDEEMTTALDSIRAEIVRRNL